MLLTLHLEDSPDAVKCSVEPVLVLEAEIQFPVFHGVHHVGYLLDILMACADDGQHRHDNRDDSYQRYDLPSFHNVMPGIPSVMPDCDRASKAVFL